MGTKGVQRKILSILHLNTALNPNPDPNPHSNRLGSTMESNDVADKTESGGGEGGRGGRGQREGPGVPRRCSGAGITSMSAAQRATLAASITENEIINMTDQNMAYVLATASYTMALPNSATSALTFTSFGAGATKAVLGAFSTDATGFGLLGVSEPSISGGTTHFLVNVDRLDDSGVPWAPTSEGLHAISALPRYLGLWPAANHVR